MHGNGGVDMYRVPKVRTRYVYSFALIGCGGAAPSDAPAGKANRGAAHDGTLLLLRDSS